MINKKALIEFPGQEPITFDLSDLQINEANLNKALSEQPGKFAYVATLAAEARAEREEAEHFLEIVRAEVDAVIRSGFDDTKKKPTEESIKKLVEISSEVKNSISDMSAWRKAELMLTAIMQAYSHRKDCAVALAANLRQQFGNLDVDV